MRQALLLAWRVAVVLLLGACLGLLVEMRASVLEQRRLMLGVAFETEPGAPTHR